MFLDKLADVKTVVFDKTGTLTEGVFKVSSVHPASISEKELLHLAAHVERNSTHPVAMALKNAFPMENDNCTISREEEVPGNGIKAVVNGKEVAVGNARYMKSLGITPADGRADGTIVHVAIDGDYAGQIVISDSIKADSADAISSLRALGVERAVMLTGDREGVAAQVATTLGLDAHYSDLLPADKLEKVQELLPLGTLAFAGDGINDAPVITRADIGIAMGALGSDSAIDAADVVIMDDKPSKIASAIKIARRTISIASQNIWFAIGVKVLVLLLALFGLANMGMAVFADVGVTVLAVLNATRALR